MYLLRIPYVGLVASTFVLLLPSPQRVAISAAIFPISLEIGHALVAHFVSELCGDLVTLTLDL